MHFRKPYILIAIFVITSVACSCGALNQIIDRLPIVGNNSGQIEKTLESLPFPQLTTEEALPPVQTEDADDAPINPQDLTGINSYQSELTIRLDGIDQNSIPVNELIVFFQQVNKEQNSLHLKSTTESSGELLQQNFEFFKIGATSYFVNMDPNVVGNRCTLMSSSDDTDNQYYSSEMTSPETIFQDVEKGDLLESNVVVNGVVVDHYQVKNASLNGSLLSITAGEVWISREGGFAVRFQAEGEGETTSFVNGNTITGKTTWNYELTQVNQLTEIALSQECVDAAEASKTGIPIPDSATEKSTFGGLTSFSSLQSLMELSAYYQEILPTLGFTPQDISEIESLVILAYKKDGKTYSIIITPGDNEGSTVLISFE